MKSNSILVLFLLTFHSISAQEIAWNKLKNPIYSQQGWSVKDACMVYHEESKVFYLFYSAFFHDNGRERSRVVGVKTDDFLTFSDPLFIWDGQQDEWIGMCSPNISKIDGKYILTYNSWGDKKGKRNQLFYAESEDLENWNKHIPLAKNITEGVRAIDAAAFQHKGTNYLMWKRQQTAQVSFNKDSVEGKWLNMGKMNMGWFENAEMFQVENQVFLLATTSEHRQKIFKLSDTLQNECAFTSWDFFGEITLPEESFNTDELMNAGFIMDHTAYDGYYYFIYAGRTEHDSHAGRGNNKLGMARSKDLLTWKIPGS